MKKHRRAHLIHLACLCLIATLQSCSKPASQPPTEAELEKYVADKTPHQVAKFVFENYGCNSCHLPGKDGKFGFTERGKQLRKQFEGCVALLTAMNVMIHVPEAQWTAEERLRHAHFQEYGCAFCHQVTPGRMGLTKTGIKLASLHASCSEVQQILSKR